MDLTLVIGNKNYSSWSLRPWLMLQYFKIPFKELQLVLGQPESKQQILKYSPSGKVPVLLNGTVAIWESLAIGEYLSDLFADKQLWPQDLTARAVARAVSCEMHAGFMHLRKFCPMNVKAHRPLAQLPDDVLADVLRIQSIWCDCRQRFGQSGPFLFGQFSIADAMFAPIIWRFNTYGITTEGVSREYFQTIYDLPAMQEWKKDALTETHVMAH